MDGHVRCRADRPPGSGVSHLHLHHHAALHARSGRQTRQERVGARSPQSRRPAGRGADAVAGLGEFRRSEEHTSELQSLMRISYAVFCLKKKKNKLQTDKTKYKNTIAYNTINK